MFTAEGSWKYETVLSSEGVRVLWPAVFRNGVDGENGEYIDQGKFEGSIGVGGIEQLVGVRAWCRRYAAAP